MYHTTRHPRDSSDDVGDAWSKSAYGCNEGTSPD